MLIIYDLKTWNIKDEKKDLNFMNILFYIKSLIFFFNLDTIFYLWLNFKLLNINNNYINNLKINDLLI